ncbi:MAG TPA: nucleoside transporter C-terminal domain-containing protein, partial [Acidobacteriota bacterium]|nr:nucleoside transporter C-terminal domain-containing protein [Acidobacteriota bacterium]
MTLLNLYSLVGCMFLLALAWLTSCNRKNVPWKTVGAGCLALALLGSIIFWLPPFRTVLLGLNAAVNLVIAAAGEGARFLFGPLAEASGDRSLGPILAFQVLPAVIFFSVVTSWLYHVGFLPMLVRCTAVIVHRGLRLSGAEALSTASNAFLGIESALVVRPFLNDMTRSELMMVMTAGLASIASTVLALYVTFLQPIFPYIAGHLISASVLSIPAAVVISKMIVPEDGHPATMGSVPPSRTYVEAKHWMGSIIWGANEGVKLGVGIGALLIGMLGLVALVDLLLGGASSWVGARFFGADVRWTLRSVLQVLAYPLILCLGLSPSEWSAAATLIGERWIVTEVVAYQDLAQMAASGRISPRGLMV